jgi:hypothetical protein
MGRRPTRTPERALPGASRVRQPLPKVAGGRADPGALAVQLLGEQPRPPALEASDRVDRLDFDHELAAELRREAVVDEPWRVEEGRMDPRAGPLDSLG